jgi:hypothetical protein
VRPHLLLTARHCVYDIAAAVWATNVVFYPGWTPAGANASLGGAWVARTLATWIGNTPELAFDIGFIQTYDDDELGCGGSAGGKPIEMYTGYLGYTYGGSYSSRHWNEFGYPAASPFNGNVLIESQSSTGAEDQGGQVDTVEVGSDMTGGCSGGPWILVFYPYAGPVNYANGLNSFKWVQPPEPGMIGGPKFFDYNFNALLQFAMGLSCP